MEERVTAGLCQDKQKYITCCDEGYKECPACHLAAILRVVYSIENSRKVCPGAISRITPVR